MKHAVGCCGSLGSSEPPTLARVWLVPLLVGLGVYLLICVAARTALGDGDTLTHIVVGRWILEHGAIPFRDTLTFTAHGQSWVPHEWLAEIVYAAAYDTLGWGGVVATMALAAAAAFTLLTRALATHLGPRRAAIAAVLALLLCIPHLLARPHILAWPFLIVWMAGVIRARDAGRVPSFALIPLMIVLVKPARRVHRRAGDSGAVGGRGRVRGARPPNACGSHGNGEFFSAWPRRAR